MLLARSASHIGGCWRDRIPVLLSVFSFIIRRIWYSSPMSLRPTQTALSNCYAISDIPMRGRKVLLSRTLEPDVPWLKTAPASTGSDREGEKKRVSIILTTALNTANWATETCMEDSFMKPGCDRGERLLWHHLNPYQRLWRNKHSR